MVTYHYLAAGLWLFGKILGHTIISPQRATDHQLITVMQIRLGQHGAVHVLSANSSTELNKEFANTYIIASYTCDKWTGTTAHDSDSAFSFIF